LNRSDELADKPLAGGAGLGEGRPALLATLRQALERRRAGLTTLAKFMLVGAGGYVAYQLTIFVAYDSSLLWFLPAKATSLRMIFFTHSDSRLLYSTLLASEVAIITSFTAHTNWTFRERSVVKRPLWMRFTQFNGKALISTAGITTAVVNLLVVWAGFHHFLAVPIGVLVAFGWNWGWDSQLIFRRQSEGDGTG
jgi:putative flippase GtrA